MKAVTITGDRFFGGTIIPYSVREMVATYYITIILLD